MFAFELWEAIDNVIELALMNRDAEIDAANCRTRYDWDKAHETGDTYCEALDRLRRAIMGEDDKDEYKDLPIEFKKEAASCDSE